MVIAGQGGREVADPWVKPERSMLHMVASAKEIKGPVKSNIILPVRDNGQEVPVYKARLPASQVYEIQQYS